jgi:hypothetical protein
MEGVGGLTTGVRSVASLRKPRTRGAPVGPEDLGPRTPEAYGR